jgi:hypothetical protein
LIIQEKLLSLDLKKDALKASLSVNNKLKINNMEAKKTPKADLENRRGLFLEIGLVVILAAVLVAFNVRKYDKEVKEVSTRTVDSEIDADILNTPPEETPRHLPKSPRLLPQTLRSWRTMPNLPMR